MAPTHGDTDDTELRAILGSVSRYRITILVCLLLGGAVAFAVSALQVKQYTAQATLLFRDPGFDQKLFGSSFLPPSSDADREAETNVALVSVDAVIRSAATRVGLSPDGARRRIEVSARGRSDVVDITATDPQPRRAADLANTVAGEYVAYRRASDRDKIGEARQLLQQQFAALPPEIQSTSRGRELLDRAQQLQVLASLQTGNAEIVDEASAPDSPSSPAPTRNTILGLLGGGLLGLAMSVLRDRLDRRIKVSDELSSRYGVPLLAVVPRTAAGVDAESLGSPSFGQHLEAGRMLRANLRYYNVDREIRSVLVTSAAEGEGKTTVALTLAIATASTGASVLLVETDLRQPAIAGRMGVKPVPGLGEVLSHQVDQGAVIQTLRLDSLPSPVALDLMVAGAVPPNPPELLESFEMERLIEAMTSQYDFVVVDTAPLGLVPDSIPLLQAVGGVVVVGSLGKSDRQAVAKLRDQLALLGVSALGVVANRAERGDGGYGYGYGYGLSTEKALARQ